MGKEKYFCWSISSWNGGAAEDCSNSGIDATNELLTFYGKLLRVQPEIHEYLCSRRGWLPSGYLEQDLPVLRVMVPAVLRAVESSGPAALVEGAQFLLRTNEAEIDQMLFKQWLRPSDLEFFAKAPDEMSRTGYLSAIS